MSSILEALRQLESSGAPVPTPAPEESKRSSRVPLIAGVIAVAFVAGAGVALVIRHERGSGTTAAPAVASSKPRTTAPIANVSRPLPVAPAIPPPVMPARAEAPWAQLATPEAQAPAPTPVVARERPMAMESERPAQPAVARTESTFSPPRSSSEPYIRLASIGYSPSASRRTAALMVEGGNPVVLHEGQSAGNVQVTLILPDRVYLRHAGQVFAIRQAD